MKPIKLNPIFEKLEPLITDEFLINLGFKRRRVFHIRDNNFTFKYTIEGYDGDLDLIAQHCAPGAIDPEEQIEYYSNVENLIEDTGNWGFHVYGENYHLTTIYTQDELLFLLKALKIDINL